jgi:hypothetical protein
MMWLMHFDRRWILGFVATAVVVVAIWRGGVLGLVGVIVFGLGYLLKWFMGWRDYKKRYGVGTETFWEFLGISTVRRDAKRRKPKDRL